MKTINVFGARQNNLKNVSLKIPKNAITVFTGVSGSGKSSLVFETIAAEAQRQINESQNSFVRNRLEHFNAAEVDRIENLNVPVIINQKRLGGNSRSTVGTATETYTFLRLIFSRLGQPFIGYSNSFSFNNPAGMCPKCSGLGSVEEVNVAALIDKSKSLNEGAIKFPTFQPGGWRWTRYVNSGYFDNDKVLKKYTKKDWELLLFAEEHKPRHPAKAWGKTMLYEGIVPRIKRSFLTRQSKEADLRSDDLAQVIVRSVCPLCKGGRLNKKALSVKLNGINIAECTKMTVVELLAFLKKLPNSKLNQAVDELKKKLENIALIGLQYLTLDRETATLSGGESQRVKMVKHLGNSLVDLLYIFDEPSIGLHAKDIENVNRILRELCEKGNTILIVEHDSSMMSIADHVVDMGPLAGSQGGKIIFEGSFSKLLHSKGVTGRYLAKKKTFNTKPKTATSYIEITKASLFNLKDVSVNIPKNVLTVVTGVAGSGKSTLINKILPKTCPDINLIDQSIFTASARSNLLTFFGVADKLRQEIASSSKVKAGLFSNNSDGACPQCKGLGIINTDLAFMDDVQEVCELCHGSGFNPKVLEHKLRGKNIVEILDMSVDESAAFFKDDAYDAILKRLIRVGLGYLTLGRRLNTLSGGERQRLKLAKELDDQQSIIVLDEPSTGLHPKDTESLMAIVDELVLLNNTVIIIEHNLDIISLADWIIDIGPGAGESGGKIVFEGTVAQLIKNDSSETGKYLKKHLAT